MAGPPMVDIWVRTPGMADGNEVKLEIPSNQYVCDIRRLATYKLSFDEFGLDRGRLEGYLQVRTLEGMRLSTRMRISQLTEQLGGTNTLIIDDCIPRSRPVPVPKPRLRFGRRELCDPGETLADAGIGVEATVEITPLGAAEGAAAGAAGSGGAVGLMVFVRSPAGAGEEVTEVTVPAGATVGELCAAYAATRLTLLVKKNVQGEVGFRFDGTSVHSVEKGGAADAAGMRKGMVIVRFADVPIRSEQDLIDVEVPLGGEGCFPVVVVPRLGDGGGA